MSDEEVTATIFIGGVATVFVECAAAGFGIRIPKGALEAIGEEGRRMLVVLPEALEQMIEAMCTPGMGLQAIASDVPSPMTKDAVAQGCKCTKNPLHEYMRDTPFIFNGCALHSGMEKLR